MPFVNIAANILHCPQINWFDLQERTVLVNVLIEFIFRFRGDRARDTRKVGNVNMFFAPKIYVSIHTPAIEKRLSLLHSLSRLHHWKITLKFRRGFCVDFCARSTLKVRIVKHDSRSEMCALITSLQVKQVHHDPSLLKSLPLATSTLKIFL